LKNRLKWLSNGRQLPAIQRQNADHVCAISSASGKRQPMTAQIQICRSTKFALDLNTGSGNLSQVKKITALIGHCACVAWKKVHAALANSSTAPLDRRKLTLA